MVMGGCDTHPASTPAASSQPTASTAATSQPAPTVPPSWSPAPTPPPENTATATAVPSPSPLAEESFSFAVAGDSWKDNPIFREIIARANGEGDAFLVIVGDITPQGLPEQYKEFQDVIADSGIPVYAVPGNHDILNGGLQEFLKLYPQRYSFDRGRAHFALVDDSEGNLAEADFRWLEVDLAQTNQPVKFVFVHIPPLLWNDGENGEAGEGASAFTALMEKYHVNYVFCGDLHAFRRFTENGVNYVITGGAGSPLHLPPPLGGYYHFVRVKIEGTKIQDEVIRVEGK